MHNICPWQRYCNFALQRLQSTSAHACIYLIQNQYVNNAFSIEENKWQRVALVNTCYYCEGKICKEFFTLFLVILDFPLRKRFAASNLRCLFVFHTLYVWLKHYKQANEMKLPILNKETFREIILSEESAHLECKLIT